MATAVVAAELSGDLATVEAAVEAYCTASDPAVMTASEAAEQVRRLAVVERKIVAAKANAAHRVDGSSIWKHAGFRTMADWMATKTGDPVAVVTGLLDTAKKLEACPATADAFAAGEVSVAAAREIAGAVAVDSGAEAGLLAVAQAGDHRRLVDTAARVRQAARSAEDEAAKHARLRARRFARTHTDADGLVIVNAGFAPTDWAPFAERLRRATDTEFTRARREGRREGVDAYAADALLALLTSGSVPQTETPATAAPQATPAAPAPSLALSDPTDPTDQTDPSDPDEPGEPTNTTDIDQPHSPDPPAPPPPTPPPRRPARPEVVVLVDGIALKRGHVSTGERCEILGVGPVSIDWVRQLLPDAIVDVLIHNGVDITTYASATRAIRKAVRLAVGTRDQFCVVRGCRQRRHTQHDHRHDYAHGGPGSADNLNVLCLFHHHQKTRDGARLERHGDNWHWYPPKATTAWISPVGADLTLWDTDTS